MKIAMRCSQEQFDAIKGKLVECKIESIGDFTNYNYLMNYRFGDKNTVTNYSGLAIIYDDADIYHEWNEYIFLNACGIETERIFKGSELQYKSSDGTWKDISYSGVQYRLKPTNLIKKQELENQILELQNQLKNL